MRANVLGCVAAIFLAACASPASAAEQRDEAPYPVGMRQIEVADGDRQIALAIFYPAALATPAPEPLAMPFFTNLRLYRDAAVADGRYPLVMFSHGRGSNPLYYAWFAEALAAQGLYRRRALSLRRQHLRPDHRLSCQQALATAA
jgi:predicted dienelactone hydrolase